MSSINCRRKYCLCHREPEMSIQSALRTEEFNFSLNSSAFCDFWCNFCNVNLLMKFPLVPLTEFECTNENDYIYINKLRGLDALSTGLNANWQNWAVERKKNTMKLVSAFLQSYGLLFASVWRAHLFTTTTATAPKTTTTNYTWAIRMKKIHFIT